MTLNKDAVVQVSLGAAVAGALALAITTGAAGWAIARFVFGEVKDDVAHIREDLTAVRARSEQENDTLTSADSEVKESLAQLVAQLEVTNARLLMLSDTISGVDERLTASISRQQEFESFMVTRIGSGAFQPAALPEDWVAAQKSIVTEITSQGDPLPAWFKFMLK